jgi:hypothetical protein
MIRDLHAGIHSTAHEITLVTGIEVISWPSISLEPSSLGREETQN